MVVNAWLDWWGLSRTRGWQPRRMCWRAASGCLLLVALIELVTALSGHASQALPSPALFRTELYSRSQREQPQWARAAQRESALRLRLHYIR